MAPRVALLIVAALLAGAAVANAGDAEAWKSRTVFQILTDRFASEQCSQRKCDDLEHYCGGTWGGMKKMMGYITSLGFDAVWMSPFTQQGPDNLGSSGYHGYWPSDFYAVNPAFGSKEDLKDVIKTYQDNGLFVMFDQVVNHVGYGDFKSFTPFNATTDFHDCEGCDGVYCLITEQGPFNNMHSYEHCKLSGLPDLNHSDPAVVDRLVTWMKWTEREFSPDGIRFDACHNSLEEAIKQLNTNLTVFTVGEMLMGDPFEWASDYIAHWVKDGAIGSAFNYPMTGALRRALREGTESMRYLAEKRAYWNKAFGERVHVMGSITDSHDIPRWMADNHTDIARYKNALAYILFSEGIPYVYYGTEQGFTVSREPLWHSGYSTAHPLWGFLATSVAYRKEAQVWKYADVEELYVDDGMFVFARGPFVVVLTNVGEQGPPSNAVMTLQDLPKRFFSQRLVNVYNQSDRLEVSKGGVGLFQPDPRGNPQVFYFGRVKDPRAFVPLTRDVAADKRTGVIIVAALLLPVALLTRLVMHLVFGRAAARAAAAGSDSMDGMDGKGDALAVLPFGAGAVSAKSTSRSWFRFEQSLFRRAAQNEQQRRRQQRQQKKQQQQGLKGAASADTDRSDSAGSKNVLGAGIGRALMETVFSLNERASADGAAGHAAGGIGHAAAATPRANDAAGGPAVVDADEQWLSTIPAYRLPHGAAGTAAASHHNDDASSVSSEVIVAAAGGGGAAAHHHNGGGIFGAAAAAAHGSGFFGGSPRAGGLPRAGSGFFSPGGGYHPMPPHQQQQQAMAPRFDATKERILHVALEYAIPHLGFNNQLMFGGLGMVVDTFIQQWPGQLAVIAPLYKACYASPAAAGCSGADGGSAAMGGGTMMGGIGGGADGGVPLRPSFIPPYERPLLTLTVDAAGVPYPVEVFKVVAGSVTYYLVQSEVFRHRERGQIYTFQDEDEMLTWLAVFNQAVAATVVRERVSYMQLHDYHGGLSLMYIPERLRPAVLYVAHNAHYDATFPIPTPARRHKIYEHLNLNAEQVAAYAEHNGRFDILRSVVMVLRGQQAGNGVVAVSPRYAKQIRQKLSVFWQLTSVGRPRNIIGILNALDMSSSLAAQTEMTTQDVLEVKRRAKLQLQQRYGLRVGDDYRLLVFVGRITHQKGCDIIAEAATYFMPRHPKLQLVVVGPVGDATGANAVGKLGALAAQHGDRMYCPVDHYVAGEEKALILRATDFCLVPSRFEPCGLVDIEFGWNGGLAVGHNTGGLGKMPGVYFTAQASHLSHLAAKLGAAVDDAMAIPEGRRRELVAEALSRRFPSDVMMQKYRDAWAMVDASYCHVLRVRQRELAQLHSHAAFFAHKWAQVNKRSAPNSPSHSAATSGAGHQQHALAAAADGSGRPAGGSCPGTPTGLNHPPGGPHKPPACPGTPGTSAAAALASRHRNRCLLAGLHGSASSLLELAHNAHDKHHQRTNSDSTTAGEPGPGALSSGGGGDGGGSGADEPPSARRRWPQAQRVSNVLLVVLQYFGIGPGVLLLSFLLLSEVVALAPGACGGLQVVQGASGAAAAGWWGSRFESLAGRLIAFYGVSTVVSPAWFLLAAHLRPVVYIRLAALLVAASYALVVAALAFADAITPALLLLAATNLVASPIVSFGFLGDEEVEVSEVGRKMLAVGDTTKYALLASAMLLAATVHSPLPHLALAGAGTLLAAAAAAWFTHPSTLSDAYQHLYLTYAGQWQQLKHLSCFWLTLLATVADSLSAMLFGFLVLTATEDLRVFALVTGVGFAASALAVLWNCWFLSSRAAELRLNATVLSLAGMPFYHALKAVAVLLLAPRAAPVALIAACGALDLVMGGRSSIMGLAGFMTLPSQEIVSIWQLAAITGLTAACAVLVGAGMATTAAGGAVSLWVLFAVIAGLEAVRTAVSAVMVRVYPRENLSAP